MPWPLKGLEAVKAALGDMLRSRRVPHALLLTGPEGCGKLSLSTALAQALNCRQPDPDLSPCLKCPSCLKIASMNHPDFTVLAPKGKLSLIPIDEVRELRSSLAYRPFEGLCKVVALRGADRFREDSGGALLKTLEEPVRDTVLILNAPSERSVMATLVSRCVRLRLPPLSRPAIREALAERGTAPEAAELLAGLSGGAVGAALALEPKAALWTWTELDRLLGLKGRPDGFSAALAWTRAFCDEVGRLRKSEPTWPASQERLRLVVGCLRLWLRDVAVLAATRDQGRLLGPRPSAAQLAWAGGLTALGMAACERAVGRLAEILTRPLRMEIVFENFWLDVLE
jgi:DNA polymerase III delta' subunit